MSATAGWSKDPYGKHEQRYFDGSQWTEHVADGAEQTIDAVPSMTIQMDPPTSDDAETTTQVDASGSGDRVSYSTGTRVAVFGGAGLLVLGAFLPWVEASMGFFSVEKAGVDGDGVFTLILGGAAVLCFWLMQSQAGRILTLIAGILALGISVIDIADVNNKAEELSSGSGAFSIEASVGVGLWLTAVGAVAVIVGAVLALREAS